MVTKWQDLLIISLVILSFLSLFFVSPIPQDLTYHAFADNRKMLGIKNFCDVISNLPFLFIGIIGILRVYKDWGTPSSWSWLLLFSAIFLVALGSSYYHLHPTNKTLTWDRLPMAIGFMSLFVVIVSDYISYKLEKWLLIPMCSIGIFSVLYWHYTDDLRIYAWVQFVSMALLLIIVLIYKSKYLQTKYLFYAFIFLFFI